MSPKASPPEEPTKGKKGRPEDKFEWKKATRTLSFWILLVLGMIVVAQLIQMGEPKEKELTYSEFQQYLDQGKIVDGTVEDRVFHGNYYTGTTKTSEQGNFKTTLPPYMDQAMLDRWKEKGVTVDFKVKTPNIFGYFINFFPWIALLVVWWIFMRRLQGGGPKGVFSFGKSRAKLQTENKPKVTFEDVAGADEAKEELKEIIAFLKDPKRFSRLGGKIPKGALLLGAPGTGKTLLARAVAGEANVPFFSMSGADFVEMFVGVGASRVRDLFDQGKKHAPCIIFIDEIDAVGRQRGAGLGGGHDEREQTLNQLLVEMDGFESNEGVILLAATNRPDVLDPALLRPGRFDRQVVVGLPDFRGREGILKVHTRKIPLAADVDLGVLAKGTPGLSGADLANITNEAALLAARGGAQAVAMQDFESAKDKVMMGMERKSFLLDEEEKKITAYHESGHALVAKLIPGSDPVHKVTIIPRGRALGLTHYLPEEKFIRSKEYCESKLTYILGGRAAESLVYNKLTTGAANDIRNATDIARAMVCDWGMSERLGPLAFGKKQEEIFLGREIAQHRDYSERTAQEIDAEIKRIVTAAEQRATSLLKSNVKKLHVLAKALLEHEILTGEAIDELLSRGSAPSNKPYRRRSHRPPEVRRQNRRTQETGVVERAENLLPAPVQKVQIVEKTHSQDSSPSGEEEQKQPESHSLPSSSDTL
jgi:cell division protease FtsH